MTENLLTDEARAWIGMEVDVECAPLTRTELQRFLAGIGQPPPGGDADPAIPPMIYQALYRVPVDPAILTKDGMPPDRRPPVGEGRGMNGEVELEFRRPLRLGDRLHGRRPWRGHIGSLSADNWAKGGSGLRRIRHRCDTNIACR